MFIWCKNSSSTVYKNTRMKESDTAAIVLTSAKNMTVSSLVCLRNTEDFEICGVDISGTPSGVSASYNPSDYIIFNDGTPYPDIVSKQTSVFVKAHTTQTIWLTFAVSNAAEVKTSRIKITLHTSKGDFEAEVVLKVYGVTLPEPKDSSFAHEYFTNPFTVFSYGENAATLPPVPFYTYERYSDDWWALMVTYAKTMKELRINSLYLNTLVLLSDAGSYRASKTQWHFDFSLLDKFVETHLEHGSFKYIAVSSIVASVFGKTIGAIDENGKMCTLEIFKDDAECWARAFYSAIYKHFEEKGWLGMLIMRLQDEPHSSEYWLWARALCRECMPGVICGEPIDTHAIAKELAPACDQYVPRLEVYDQGKDFYECRAEAGDEVWVYSCCYPEEPWWLNRFIDLPLLYTRLLYWGCFSQNVRGFLHWGFDHWATGEYGLFPGSRYKGDGFIVYPDPENNSVKLSARAIATRDGMQDVELLYLLAKKDAEVAKRIAKGLVRSFRDFNKDENAPDKARETILELL